MSRIAMVYRVFYIFLGWAAKVEDFGRKVELSRRNGEFFRLNVECSGFKVEISSRYVEHFSPNVEQVTL